jgi:uracil-DNA glycosylase family 4
MTDPESLIVDAADARVFHDAGWCDNQVCEYCRAEYEASHSPAPPPAPTRDMSADRDQARDKFFTGLSHREVDEQFPLQPLLSEGLPPPGPDFLREAAILGDPPLKAARRKKGEPPLPPPDRPWLEALSRSALYRHDFCLNVASPNGKAAAMEYVRFVPGHRFDAAGSGPVRCDVMLVGQIPGYEEARTLLNFSGKASTDLFRAFADLHVPVSEFSTWYVTNLVRFPHPDPKSGNRIVGDWIKDCLPLLYQELCLVRPRYVLLLGGEASKALLGKAAKVKELTGQVKELSVPVVEKDGSIGEHRFKTMTCLHPAAVSRNPGDYHQLLSGLRLFVNLVRGGNVGADETGLERHYLYRLADLRAMVDRVLSETADGATLALDCEWDGERPGEPGAYLRTVQFSHRPRFGAAVVLTLQGGTPNPDLTVGDARDELLRLCKSRPGRLVRVAGHNFKSDLPWLLDLGVDLRPEFDAPDDEPNPDGATRLFGWQRTKSFGGFDTICAAHAYDETGPMKLEVLGATLLGTPRYDDRLHAFNEAYCKEHGIKVSDLTGYGHVPDEILLPYSVYDVDLTIRLVELYNGRPGRPGLLDADRFGNSSREWFWHCQGEAPVLAEMEAEGLVIDRARTEALMGVYQHAVTERLEAFRQNQHWPNFNPNSVYHKREWLFGPSLNGKYDKKTGQSISVRPEGAVTLGLTPLADSAEGRPWRPEHSVRRVPGAPDPSTDKTTLGILALTAKVAEVAELRDLLQINQILKTVLKPPTAQGDGSDPEYEKGLLSFTDSRSRVHTHFLFAETGRLRSAMPNLQNLPGEDKEEKYAKILGRLYAYSLRSLFRARPGYVLVDVDYSGAEVALAAWMADDPVLIDHYRRMTLPKSHPDFYDVHCQNAVRTFQLACAPTKEGLKSIGRVGLRTGAKRAIFGSFYGQGAQAAAMQANEEGAGITVDEVQALLDFLYVQYSRLYGDFFPSCHERVRAGWMRNCFGCVSRFPSVSDQERLAALEREASNRPIQGGVAGAMKVAERNFYRHRRDNPGRPGSGFIFNAQVHDSLMFEVPIPELEVFNDEVIPECMIRGVPIIPTDLEGNPTGKGPYYLGVKAEVFLRWGEAISRDEATASGIPERFASKK